MIKVTADIFSGRPNPEWVITGNEAKTILKKISQAPEAIAPADSGFSGLGNRGLIVEVLSDHLRLALEFSTFRIAGGESANEERGREIAERLVTAMSRQGAARHPALISAQKGPHKPLQAPLNARLQRFILETLPISVRDVRRPPTATAAKKLEFRAVSSKTACGIEKTAFNPGFWNDAAHITRNNCYNYASNRRTDTFAQPGRASGHMFTLINCADVTKGAISDGASVNCAPANQAPRWYMALVIAPSPGFIDYHWYRFSKEAFWGHKPGGTAARNTDNSGRIIKNPQFADRGPYTIFCGYMYAQKRMVVR